MKVFRTLWLAKVYRFLIRSTMDQGKTEREDTESSVPRPKLLKVDAVAKGKTHQLKYTPSILDFQKELEMGARKAV